MHTKCFFGKKEPDVFSVGDLWFSKNTIRVAEEQNGNILWVEKR